MKNFSLFVFYLLVTICVTANVNAKDMEIEIKQTIQLPQPDKNVEMSLFTALQNRKSTRQFADRKIDNQTLSRLLWAAAGINRPDENRLTAPSAMNRQSITIYVVLEEGTYRWNSFKNTLNLVSDKDLRSAVKNDQEGTSDFPLALLMVGDNAKFDASVIDEPLQMVVLDAGIISQNINLAATALGLNNVPRVNMNSDVLRKELRLSAAQFPIMNNLIGW